MVGLVLEGPELWHEITSIVGHWRFTHRLHFSLPENPVPNWAKLAAFVGWLFIVVGVAGEYVADSFVSRADGYVQRFDEILLTEAQKESAHAEATAKGFDAQIADSNAKAKSAEATAKQFEAQIAGAQRDAAESKKDAESERLERAKLEARMAPRRVSSEQAKELCAGIHLTGRHTLDVGSSFGTTEIDDFGEDIAKALAGCFFVTFTKSALILPVPRPMRIAFAPDRKSDADIIANAILNAKIVRSPIEQIPAPDATEHPDALRLFIGPKLE